MAAKEFTATSVLTYIKGKPVQNFCFFDWLSVHNLSPVTLENVLIEARYLSQTFDVGALGNLNTPDNSASAAWNSLSNALQAKFPEYSDVINAARRRVNSYFRVNEKQREYTFNFDQQTTNHSRIVLESLRKSTDEMRLAHNYSQAIQIEIAQHKVINPILSEMAAFIGELALLDYLVDIGHWQSKSLEATWHQENRQYCGIDAYTLLSNCADNAAPYNYRWNYPIARTLAVKLYESVSEEKLWQVFCGNTPLDECLDMACF